MNAVDDEYSTGGIKLSHTITRFNEHLDVRSQWIIKAIAEQFIVNLEDDKTGIDLRRKASELMIRYAGHHDHKSVIKSIIDGVELTATQLDSLPPIPATRQLHIDMSKLAKNVAMHDVGSVVSRWIRNVANFGTNLSVAPLLAELTTTQRRFVDHAGMAFIERASILLNDPSAVTRLADTRDGFDSIVEDVNPMFDHLLFKFVLMRRDESVTITKAERDFIDQVVTDPLWDDLSDWQAFAHYHAFRNATINRPTFVKQMSMEDMQVYKAAYEDFATSTDDNRAKIEKQREIISTQMASKSTLGSGPRSAIDRKMLMKQSGVPPRVLVARDEVFLRDKYFQYHLDNVALRKAKIHFTRMSDRDRHFVRYALHNIFDNVRARGTLKGNGFLYYK